MPPTEESSPHWHLMKHDDGTVFGPITFDQLRSWAETAQISPLDKISANQKEWNRAPTFPDLEMDWLVQSSPGQLYGPTTIGAVKEFIRAGEIALDSMAINCKSGEEVVVEEIPQLKVEEELGIDSYEPGKSSTKENLQQRIIDLEEVILEERSLRRSVEERYNKLCAKYKDETGKDA